MIKKRFTLKNIIDVLTISVKFKSQFNRSNLKIPRSKIDKNQPTMRVSVVPIEYGLNMLNNLGPSVKISIVEIMV